ncbi:MAG TPA: DegV family protein [Anaerolineae bacterium]|nr:DegV family protein [Anaerolineae bacterium]
MIKIVTDSTNNLSEDVLKRYDIRVAPISIQFGDETYEEEIDIDRDTFYRKIDEMGILPTSAQPTPAWFTKHYTELTEQGHSILAITITSKHSGTYESAVLAKSMVPQADVEVFDSLSISLGTGWMVLEAARAIEEGQDRQQILRRLEGIRDRHTFVFTPATLRYLQMSGRVGTLQGALASLLSVKPIITLEDGVLEARENIRTRGKATDRLISFTEETLGLTDPVNLAVVHARAPEEGQALLERAKSHFNCKEIMIADLVASLAVHGGPGVLMLTGYKV